MCVNRVKEPIGVKYHINKVVPRATKGHAGQLKVRISKMIERRKHNSTTLSTLLVSQVAGNRAIRVFML